MMRASTVTGLVIGISILVSLPAPAQIRASERGSVSQTVDGTIITVDYSRPQIRGRDSAFAAKGNGVVYWGEVWTPGANWATTFEFSKPVTLNGHDVAAGKYSVWYVPQPDEWTVGLHATARLFHTQHPADSEFVVSFKVTPQPTDDRENVLQFSFPVVTHTGTTLRMHWERTAVDLDIGVPPSRPPTNMTAEEMAPYLGSYTLTAEDDTTVRKVEVLAAGQAIRVVVDGWGKWAVELIPTQEEHRFLTAWLRDGELYDVEDQAPFVFDMDGGRAVGFRVINATENTTWMTGTRTN